MDSKKQKEKFGAIYDSLLTDAESDQSMETVPNVPAQLLKKTLDECNEAAKAEVMRHSDPTKLDIIDNEKFVDIWNSATFKQKTIFVSFVTCTIFGLVGFITVVTWIFAFKV